MKKQLICSVLLISMLAAVSCGDTAQPSGETTATDSTVETVTSIADDSRDAVPTSITEKLDFGGKTVTILSRETAEFVNEFSADEENGDTMNDAIYARNLAVEERLNVKIDMMTRPGAWGQHTQFNSDVVKEVMAGETAYDVISYYAYAMPMIAQQNVLYNLKNLDYIDFTKPWWHQRFIENAEVYGKLYALIGDINLTTITYRSALFFNKTKADEYLSGVDLYGKVLEGSWTQEYFIGLVKDIYKDLNGDSVVDDLDFFGYDGNGAADPFPVGGGVTYTKKTANGGYEWNLFTEKNNTIMERFYNAFTNNDGFYFIDVADDNRFLESRCIFASKKFSLTEQLRDFKDDYGILPHPKFDEKQETYYSIANDNYSQIAVPATCKDPELVGAFLELMGEYSYKTVTPAYYEVAMKGKYLRDDESCQMFDLILDGAWYDFANINTSVLDNPVFITRQAQYHKDGNNFASMWASRENTLTAALTQLLDDYKNN